MENSVNIKLVSYARTIRSDKLHVLPIFDIVAYIKGRPS